MLRNVAVLALPEVGVFELGVLCELFGSDRTADGLPGYDFAVATVDGRPVPLQVDGDYIGDAAEAVFGVWPGALSVVA